MAFSEISYQKHAVGILQRSLQHGRLAHAYVFVGANGETRETLAKSLAQALNCESRRANKESAFPGDGCGKCASCKKISEATHPDVYWVRPESKSRRITIDKIRELEKSVNLKPREGRMKVGIIVDADRMGHEASNAFLKTLEEPPANSVLLLLTDNADRLLPTIISRCLPVRLASSTTGKLSNIQEKALKWVVSSAPSSAKESAVVIKYRALAALNALLQSLRKEKETEVSTAWNVEQWSSYDKEIRERLEEELEAAIEAEYRAARQEVLTTLLAWHRDVLVMVEGADHKLLMFPQHAEALKRQAAALDYAQAAANVETIERIRQHLEQNIREPLALEVGLLQLK